MIRKTLTTIAIALTAFGAFGSAAYADGADGLPYPTDGEGAATDVALHFAHEVITQEGCTVPSTDADIFALASAIADGSVVCVQSAAAPAFVVPRPCVEGVEVFTIEAWSLAVAMPRERCSIDMGRGWMLTEILPAADARYECDHMGGTYEFIGSRDGGFRLDVCHDVDY